MLPTTSAAPQRTSWIPQYFRRMMKFSQMDMEATFYQMFLLCVSPLRAYKFTTMHKQTKNQWARDDPAFVALMCFFMGICSFAYAIAFNREGFLTMLRVMFSTILIDFLLVGCCIATCNWLLANKFLRVTTPHGVEQSVEWLYAFDVHCNSFFPLFLLLYVLQYFLLPILLRELFFATFLANSMYMISLAYYFHITALGYSALPFLKNTEMFYYPCLGLVLLFILSLLLNYNICALIMNTYFG